MKANKQKNLLKGILSNRVNLASLRQSRGGMRIWKMIGPNLYQDCYSDTVTTEEELQKEAQEPGLVTGFNILPPH